jgi:FkbM family methyltransferase
MTADGGARALDSVVRAVVRGYRRIPFRVPRLGLERAYRAYVSRQRTRTIVTTLDGITYELDLNEMIDSTLYFEGVWERRATFTIATLLRPGMTVLDVGANMGYFTLTFAKLVGETGKVVAFEPTAWAVAKLRRNIDLNRFANIEVEKMALSDAPANREITASERAFKASWTFSGDQRPGTERVRFLPLDTFVRETGLAAVDFVKIDVDGNEYRVILGARETLRTHRPIMLLEIGRMTMDVVEDRPEDLVALLTGLGYSFFTEDSRYSFSGGAELLEWIPYQGANILCVPKESVHVQRISERRRKTPSI